MYETFTVLEAITVRQRLESLRLSQLGGRQSVSRSRERMLDFDEDVDYNLGKECFHNAILTGKSDEMCRGEVHVVACTRMGVNYTQCIHILYEI